MLRECVTFPLLQAASNVGASTVRRGMVRQAMAQGESAFGSMSEASALSQGLRSGASRAVLGKAANTLSSSMASSTSETVPRAAWAALVRKFASDALAPLDTFQRRHNSITDEEAKVRRCYGRVQSFRCYSSAWLC